MHRYLAFLSTILSLLALVVSAAPVQAQERPLLILRLESELGYRLVDRQAGLSGTVYALTRDSENQAQQSVQIAYDARNRPIVLRLVQVMNAESGTPEMIQAAQQVARLVVPDWQDAEAELAARLAPPLTDFVATGTSQGTTIAIPETTPAGLQFVAEERLAVLDFPVTSHASQQLSERDLKSIISDTSFVFSVNHAGNQVAPGTEHHRYHAPDGRFGGISADGTPENGSWSLTPDGQYCVETAPHPVLVCSYVFEDGSHRYLLVPVTAGDAASTEGTAGFQSFTTQYGNPEGFAVPRRADATPAAVTRMIVIGQTEERRNPDGTGARIYLDKNGQARGFRDGQPIVGRWSVLRDGRRCLINQPGELANTSANTSATAWECAFLSETDGGTFRIFDAASQLLGEVLYQDGNPNGF